MSQEIRIAISSPPDRERLVAEIFVGTDQIAEVNYETGEFSVELYPRSDGTPWVLSHESLASSLNDAKAQLSARLGLNA